MSIRPEISDKNTEVILKISSELRELYISPTQVTNILISALNETLTTEQMKEIVELHVKRLIGESKKHQS